MNIIVIRKAGIKQTV